MEKNEVEYWVKQIAARACVWLKQCGTGLCVRDKQCGTQRVNTFTAEPENSRDTLTHSAVLFPRILGLEIQWSAAIYRSRFVIFILYTTKLHALGNTVESSLVVFHCFPGTRDG